MGNRRCQNWWLLTSFRLKHSMNLDWNLLGIFKSFGASFFNFVSAFLLLCLFGKFV